MVPLIFSIFLSTLSPPMAASITMPQAERVVLGATLEDVDEFLQEEATAIMITGAFGKGGFTAWYPNSKYIVRFDATIGMFVGYKKQRK